MTISGFVEFSPFIRCLWFRPWTSSVRPFLRAKEGVFCVFRINKLQINTQKYPVEAVRGSPDKYSSYETPSRSRRHKYDIPTARKDEEETGRKRARERFSEDQVAAMTELAEKAGWSITALTWEERVKFCQDYNITKERLCNFFNNRKPKEMKRGRMQFMRRSSMPHGFESHFDASHYPPTDGNDTHMQTEDTFLKRMNE